MRRARWIRPDSPDAAVGPRRTNVPDPDQPGRTGLYGSGQPVRSGGTAIAPVRSTVGTTTGPAGGSTGGSRRGQSRTNPFQAAMDALDRTAGFEPQNAMEAIHLIKEAAGFIEHVEVVLDQIGWSLVNAVYFDPSVTEFFENLGKYLRPAADWMHEGHAAILAAHAEQVQAIEERDPRKAKWDQSAHDL